MMNFACNNALGLVCGHIVYFLFLSLISMFRKLRYDLSLQKFCYIMGNEKCFNKKIQNRNYILISLVSEKNLIFILKKFKFIPRFFDVIFFNSLNFSNKCKPK